MLWIFESKIKLFYSFIELATNPSGKKPDKKRRCVETDNALS